MELQAVPLVQKFQTVPPKSDASALTEVARKGKGTFQFRNIHTTVHLTVYYNFKQTTKEN